MWGLGGYIPDLDGKLSAEKQKAREKNQGASSETYHRCLGYVVSQFGAMEETGFKYDLRLGNRLKTVRVRPYLACGIGDGKSADMLSNRVGAHRHAKRISRGCACCHDEADDVEKECNFQQLSEEMAGCFRIMEMGQEEIAEHILVEDIRKEARKEQASGSNKRRRRHDDKRRMYKEMNSEGKNRLDKRAGKLWSSTRKTMINAGITPSRNAFLAEGVTFGGDPQSIFAHTSRQT